MVAAECVVLTGTNDHSYWKLLGRVAKVATGDVDNALKAAHQDVEDVRSPPPLPHQKLVLELAFQSLGMPAVLPPAEEVNRVEKAISESRAEQARSSML